MTVTKAGCFFVKFCAADDNNNKIYLYCTHQNTVTESLQTLKGTQNDYKTLSEAYKRINA